MEYLSISSLCLFCDFLRQSSKFPPSLFWILLALSCSETFTQTRRQSRLFLCAHQPLSRLSTISGESFDDILFCSSKSNDRSTSRSSLASELSCSTVSPLVLASSLKTSPPFNDDQSREDAILDTSVEVPLPGGPLIVTLSNVSSPLASAYIASKEALWSPRNHV